MPLYVAIVAHVLALSDESLMRFWRGHLLWIVFLELQVLWQYCTAASLYMLVPRDSLESLQGKLSHRSSFGVCCCLAGVCSSHTIKQGDTFWALAQQRGVTVAAIQAVNPGVVPDQLQLGQKINMPCAGNTAPP
jgi:nucleoid-associated protein YgaU